MPFQLLSAGVGTPHRRFSGYQEHGGSSRSRVDYTNYKAVPLAISFDEATEVTLNGLLPRFHQL